MKPVQPFSAFLQFLVPLLLLPLAVSGLELPQAGLVLHLDAGSIRGISDGSPLHAGWSDTTSSAITAVSGTPPTYVADAGSGTPAVRFNGANQYLEASLATGPEASVFIVFAHQRVGSSVNYRDTLITTTGSGSTINLSSSRSSTIAPDYPSFNAVANSGVSFQTWVNGHDTGAVTGDIFRGRFYVGSAVYTGLPSREALLIGARGTNGFNAGQNDIREILLYNRALPDAEREAVQRYLGSKHDIELVWRPLDHPVEATPHVLGSQQFGTHYSFGESGISTLDYARATLRQGNRVVKFRLSSKFANEDGFTADATINSLVKLVRDQPEVKTILDLPLTDYLFWVASFSVPNWGNQLDGNGLRPAKAAEIYKEVYDLVVHLLTTYSGTGKRFYLGNWEGDWMLVPTEYRNNPDGIPRNRVQGMIDWANIRQKAVDDAKAATPHSGVDVWFYLEMNKADWMRDGLTCVANSVIPEMPKLDMISISSYSIHKDRWGGQRNKSLVHADLDLVQDLIEAKPDASIPGSRIIIGEYGWIYNSTLYSSWEEFAQTHLVTARNFLSWQGGTLRFVLQWQFFNQATLENNSSLSREMCQIGPDNDRRPLYYLHENFHRLMRRWVDDYHMRTGSLPSPRAYADQATHFLDSGLVSLSAYNPELFFSRYDTWKRYHFPDAGEAASVAISGPEADPYGTGLSNLLRYGLRMGKFGYDVSRLPHLRRDGNGFAFAVPLDPAKTDLRWIVQADSTLSQWSLDLFDSATDAAPLPGDWLEVSDGGMVARGEPVFYRLQIQLIP